MKKLLQLLTVLAVGGSLNAQSIVTDIPQYSAAVLEEYTGIHCQFCPDGHLIAKNFKNAYPGKVVLMNIHTGSFATPDPNDPDFRTPYGSALAGQTGLTGYPSGTINREIFSQFNSDMALSRSNWRTAGEQMLEMPSPVNVGATTSYDPSTRVLTINVEVYYTGNASNSNYNLLNIALLQDSVPGPQTGANTYNPGDVLPNGEYLHAHMLRDLITGQWGDTISNTSQGSLFTKTYTDTLPASINSVPLLARNAHLAIFVTETREDITQGIRVDVMNDSNDGNNAPIYGNLTGVGTTIVDGMPSTAQTFNFDFTSNLSGSNDFEFELKSDAPSDWTATYKVNGTSYTGSQVLSLSGNNANNMEVEITPGAIAAVAKFTLEMHPVNDTVNVVEQDFYVISGVTDLIVNGSGGFGDGGTYNWDQVYESALSNAGSNSFDLITADMMTEALNAGAMSDVDHLYMNIAWRFPSFSNQEANALMNFMDNGGNVFVAGQDIGWDINSPNGYGTAVTRALYSNYFNANYQSDGSTSNSQLTADSADAVFSTVASSTVVDKYGGNMYPDVIFGKNGAETVFYYNGVYSPTSGAGVRYLGNYKMVYLGIGLEMIQDVAVKNQIMDLTHAWFHGQISTDEFDFAAKGFSVYPNPSKGKFELHLPVEGNYRYQLRDMTGRIIESAEFSAEAGSRAMSFDNLPQGTYLLHLQYGEQSLSRKLVID